MTKKKKGQLAKAIHIASTVFLHETDQSGTPYILHCLNVMHQMPQDDVDLMCIAVLHDVVEDSDWTFTQLESEGFSSRVIEALILLTRGKNTSYDDYIKGISANKDAVTVKLADLKHNSDITRIKGLRKKDFDRLEKYHRSFVYLQQVVNKGAFEAIEGALKTLEPFTG